MKIATVFQTMSAVAALVDSVKAANSDGNVSADEWLHVLSHGVMPILELHGVKVNSPLPTATVSKASEVADQVSAAIAIFQALDATAPAGMTVKATSGQ